MICVSAIRDLTRCLLSYVYREVFLCTASWVYRGPPQFLLPISWTMKTIRLSRPCLWSPSLYPSSPSGPCLPPCIPHYPSSCATRYTSLSRFLCLLFLPVCLSISSFSSPLHRTHIEDATTTHTQIQKVRTIAQPNPGFMRQLEQYQCLLEQQTTAAGAQKSVGVGIHLARKSVNHTDNLAF